MSEIMSVASFACELCGEIHTAGESRFRIKEYRCSQVCDQLGCEERIKQRSLETCLEVTVEIKGMSKQIADALVAKTPLQPVEHSNHRTGWDFTTLFIITAGSSVRVGFIRPNTRAHPLHIELDLTALKKADPENWQTTLETLGVLS